ncbi:lipopolysaccharide biosynthesis protein [Kocuria sp. CPCC 205263]|uniref:lipopolysaccharide biosynthesis protein n=1 Tax=Kocuria sp. CPCC 205263 TaxID=3073555 RepID=UPI0034D74517
MATVLEYGEEQGRPLKKSVAWNGASLIGRQIFLLGFSVVLARLLGPEAYGLVAQASVYIAFAILILDQGLTAALVSSSRVTIDTVRAAAGLNIVLSLVLFAVTFAVAPATAAFFNTPELELVLKVLGGGLVLKGLAIVPRMVLMRSFAFKPIAIADVLGALLGGLAGLAAAFGGLGYWSIVIQVIANDFVVAIMLMGAARFFRPSMRFSHLKQIFGFGSRVFLGNVVSVTSRNVDNLLVGKFYGAADLALYSLAYRVLLTPVQMVGQMVSRVLFPAIASHKANLPEVSRLTLRSMSAISLITFPLMTFVAISGEDAVLVFLGSSWLGAVPVLQILALTGARQSVTSIHAPLLLGMGKSQTHLRFNLIAAAVQIGGIVAGLSWGMVGVAWGYTIAGLVLTPYIAYLHKATARTSYKSMLGSLVPAISLSAWVAAPYAMLMIVPLPPFARLVCGGLLGCVVMVVVLRFLHRKAWGQVRADAHFFFLKRK